jgi:hypothetical protein
LVTVGGFGFNGAANLVISGFNTTSETTVAGDSHDIVIDNVSCNISGASKLGDPNCFLFRDTAHDLVLKNSRARGGWDAVKVYSGNSSSAWVKNLTVSGNDLSDAYEDDMHIDGADSMLVQNNNIHDPAANGQHNDGLQTQASTNLQIVGNRFSYVTQPVTAWIGMAMMLGNVPAQFPDRKVVGTYVANNVVAHWQPGRALIMNGTEGTTIVNNTFVDNGNPAVNDPSITISNQGSAGGQNPGLEIWNNILKSIYDDSGSNPPAFCDSNLITAPYSGMSGTNVLTANPLFADASYALSAASPARGRGLTRSGTPSTDINGDLRPSPPGLGATR